MFVSQQGVLKNSFPCNTVAGSQIGKVSEPSIVHLELKEIRFWLKYNLVNIFKLNFLQLILAYKLLW